MGAILQAGRNCWRLERADRLTFLIDAAAYYSALASALREARRCVLILGWDVDPRVRLERDGDENRRLSELLETLVRERRDLHVYVLEWDFTLLYTMGGESRPIFARSRPSHPRIHFQDDSSHPTGGSQHQKVVIVDDRVAFVGGVDITVGRWDTPEHRPAHPLRVGPSGRPYPPIHDMQVALAGPAAAALADLARDRWRRATGDRLPPPPPQTEGDPWPSALAVDAESIEVGIARTLPELDDWPQVMEVERLYLDAIAAARRWIYVESQYLTSAVIADAIADRLRDETGPEIVVILTRDSSGWLEQGTMDVLRARILRKLRAQSGHRRLCVYYPVVKDDGEDLPVYVHSKVMIVDDTFLRVGSANISNRSMGLDSECDVAFEASGDPRRREVISGLRDRLLGEHLGVPAERVGERLASTGSLIGAVEALRGGPRTLLPLEHEPPDWLMEAIPDRQVIDPERPVNLEHWIDRQVPGHARRLAAGRILGLATVAALAGLLTALLTIGPVDGALVGAWIAERLPVPHGIAAPLFVAVAYVVGCVLLVPITLLILGTLLVFGPLGGLGYSALGVSAGAAVTYAIGRRLPRDRIRRLAGARINRISAELARKGFLGMLTLRILPLASFSLVSYVAGAARVRFGDFALSTALGLAPLLFSVALLADRLEAVLANPGIFNLVTLVLVTVAIAGIGFLLSWRLSRARRRG